MQDLPRPQGASSRAFVSAEEVARRAGVSRSAVSRTFTPGASVSPETHLRVMQAATELGYHVNHLARGLSRRQSGIVCLVVADLDTPHISRLVLALSRRLQAEGRVAVVLSLGGPADDPAQVLQQTFNYRAEATIVMSGTPAQSIVRRALDYGQRLVLINRDDPIQGPDNIRIANGEAALAALRAFVRAGCRHPAVANSGRPTPSLLSRETAFLAGARGLGLAPAVAREGTGSNYDTGVAAARRLFTAAERPDAVFCVSDLVALGVMDSVRNDFGLRVPEDVSIIGFDDIPQADWLSYRLTTFEQPADEIAAAAVGLAVTERDEGDEPAVVEIAPRLVWRHTVRR